MPILVRPVREQLEHDRVIRFLQAKLKRKYDITTNVGNEQNAGVRSGALTLYPDLVLASGRKTVGVIEVETTESVNHLEAMAQWAHFGRSRLAFYLYVPANTVEIARRLAEEIHVSVTELWSFHAIGDQIRFALMHRGPSAPTMAASAAPRTATPKAAPARNGGKPARGQARTSARPKAAGRAAAKRPAARASRPASSKKAGRTQGQKRK